MKLNSRLMLKNISNKNLIRKYEDEVCFSNDSNL